MYKPIHPKPNWKEQIGGVEYLCVDYMTYYKTVLSNLGGFLYWKSFCNALWCFYGTGRIILALRFNVSNDY